VAFVGWGKIYKTVIIHIILICLYGRERVLVAKVSICDHLVQPINVTINSDIHIVAATKAAENYRNVSVGLNIFFEVNRLIESPTLTIDEIVYTLEFYLCSDYKVNDNIQIT